MKNQVFPISIAKISLLLVRHGPDKIFITTNLDPAMPDVGEPATFQMEVASGYGEEWIRNNLPYVEYEVIDSGSGKTRTVNPPIEQNPYEKGDGIRAFLQIVDPARHRCEIGNYFAMSSDSVVPVDPLAWAAVLRGMEVKEEYAESWCLALEAISEFSGIHEDVLQEVVDEYETDMGRSVEERLATGIEKAEAIERAGTKS